MLGAGKQDNKSGLHLGSVHLIRQQHDVTCSLDCECAYSPVMRSFRRTKKGVPSRELPSDFSYFRLWLSPPGTEAEQCDVLS